MLGEPAGILEDFVLAEEAELAFLMGCAQRLQEAIAEPGAEDFHRQEEVLPRCDPLMLLSHGVYRAQAPCGAQPTAGDDAVDMRMVDERGPPGVEHRRDADLGAQMSFVAGDREQGLGCDLE